MFCPRCMEEIGEDEWVFGRKDFVSNDSVDDLLFKLLRIEDIFGYANEQ